MRRKIPVRILLLVVASALVPRAAKAEPCPGPIRDIITSYGQAWSGQGDALGNLARVVSPAYRRAGVASFVHLDGLDALTSFVRSARADFWQDLVIAPNLDTSSCRSLPDGYEAIVPWHMTGAYHYHVANPRPVAIDGVSRLTIRSTRAGHLIAEETVQLDDAALLRAIGPLPQDDAVDSGNNSAFGNLSGRVTLNGQNVPDGHTVTCIDGSGGPFQSGPTASGNYRCNNVTAGQVTIDYDGHSDGPCPRTVENGEEETCDANVTGCGQMTVSFAACLVPGTLRRLLRKRSRSHILAG